ncbi:High cysteine membrane protein Group 6 [Giardia duodenalis]|uniref:High cysteine membrane protein Group 6 n=1 Tax=Giardia intestinalis (strain ATCC 50803 / WB clone C6) TaxID=184922 RepID=A8B2D7_GIAIC|nr:High cysteine membrane protein Group 6 [Giardia intestinalis]KAE8302959.1 High cysteine membrane protein Group 6 [Giardia intestinalis]|eukprot:XP_001709948.1 High cysteine membrane protein Group 6 [Giardia lamblia ATCC 50803]
MLLTAFCIMASVLAATCTVEASTRDCAESKCEMVGGTEVCTECKYAGNVPINGACKQKGDSAVTTAGCKKANGTGLAEDKVCERCDGAYFLYKGGCYGVDNEPGQKLCTKAAEGACTEAAPGYFVPPNVAGSDQSVIACNYTISVPVLDGRSYMGVAHCTLCDSPKIASDPTPKPAVCTACEDGYFLGAAGDKESKCILCGDTSGSTWKGVDGCLKCTASGKADTPATCTECQEGKYLKGGDPTSCILRNACTGTHFPNDNVENKKKCLPCGENANGGIENCAECSLLSSVSGSATVLIKCSKCGSDKKLSPLKDACLDSCPVGTYDKQSVCTPCHSSCASCTDTTSTTCTACYSGFVLNTTTGASAGTCIQECTGQYAENCADGQCTAIVGGSKYCSKCKAGYVPVDGVCVSTTTRAVTGCTPGDGVCTACTGSYFLQSGGCYQSTVYPGNTLCSSATNGKCTSCTNGQTADKNSGSCPACPDGCSKCTGSASPQQCSGCFPGYYKSGDKCVKCDASANGITGVPNCISCAPPSNGQGSVTCYVNGSGASRADANRSGLSPSAIAGVSVVVIIVVGGLAGFLC